MVVRGAGAKSKRPCRSLRGFKGGILSRERMPLLYGGERSNAAGGGAGSLPPWERHSRATECARLIDASKRRDSWRSHVHRTCIPQAAQFFEPKTANVRGRGGRPLVFLSGDLKGDTLFEKRVSPFVRQWRSAPHYPYSAARCNLPSPAKRGIKRDTLFEKRVSPFDFRSLHRCRIIF